MLYGHGTRTCKSNLADQGYGTGQTRSNHHGLSGRSQHRTFRDVYIPGEPGSCGSNSGSIGSSYSPTVYADAGRYMDTYQTEGAHRRQTLPGKRLQDDVCLCGIRIGHVSRTGKGDSKLKINEKR